MLCQDLNGCRSLSFFLFYLFNPFHLGVVAAVVFFYLLQSAICLLDGDSLLYLLCLLYLLILFSFIQGKGRLAGWFWSLTA